MNSKKHMHLSSIKDIASIIVEILIIESNLVYKYKTSAYIEEKYLKYAKKDKYGWKSFNYLKNNSEEIKNGTRNEIEF